MNPSNCAVVLRGEIASPATSVKGAKVIFGWAAAYGEDKGPGPSCLKTTLLLIGVRLNVPCDRPPTLDCGGPVVKNPSGKPHPAVATWKTNGHRSFSIILSVDLDRRWDKRTVRPVVPRKKEGRIRLRILAGLLLAVVKLCHVG